jgi:hypothetical protein
MNQLIKDYQTLIVGSLGFLGVMATLWGNGCLQRKLEEWRERREARVLRTALREELRQQKLILQETTQSLAASTLSGEHERGGTVIPFVGRSDEVFKASFDKLGLLDGRQLSAVFEAYLALRTLTWRLRRLEQEDERFKPEPDHVWLTSRNFKRANQLHDQMIPTIDAAIDELDRSASPRPTWREKTAIAL